MQQNTFLNKTILRGVVGRVAVTNVETARIANLSLVTDYCYLLKDRSPVLETTWHNVSITEVKGGCDVSEIQKGSVIEITGRIRAKRVVMASGEERTMYFLTAKSSDTKLLGTHGEKVVLSAEDGDCRSIDTLYGLYKGAEESLREALVDRLVDRMAGIDGGKLLFQEPVEILYENAVKFKRHYGNGLYTDYLVIGIQRSILESGPLNEHLSVIGWGTDGDVNVFPVSDLDVDTLRDLDTFIGDLFKGDDIELMGNSLRFKEGSPNRIPDFKPLDI